MCEYPLDEFTGKLRKFQDLDVNTKSGASKSRYLRAWGQKLRWGFCMKEEVAKLRVYLATHVGSLNIRLLTLGLYVV